MRRYVHSLLGPDQVSAQCILWENDTTILTHSKKFGMYIILSDVSLQIHSWWYEGLFLWSCLHNLTSVSQREDAKSNKMPVAWGSSSSIFFHDDVNVLHARNYYTNGFKSTVCNRLITFWLHSDFTDPARLHVWQQLSCLSMDELRPVGELCISGGKLYLKQAG